MSEWFKWRGNFFNKEGLAGLTLYGENSLAFRTMGGEAIVYGYDTAAERDSALKDAEEIFIRPKEMLVLEGGKPGEEDDVTDWKAEYLKVVERNANLEVQVQAAHDRIEELIRMGLLR